MPKIPDIEWNSYDNNRSFLTDNHDEIDTIIQDLNSGDGIGKIYNFSEEFNEIKKLLDESFLVDGNPKLTEGITDIENEINMEHNDDIKNIVDTINNNLDAHQSEEAETLYKKVVDKYQDELDVLVENINNYNNSLNEENAEYQIGITGFPCQMTGELLNVGELSNEIINGFEELDKIYSYYQEAEELCYKYGNKNHKNLKEIMKNTLKDNVDSVKENIENSFGKPGTSLSSPSGEITPLPGKSLDISQGNEVTLPEKNITLDGKYIIGAGGTKWRYEDGYYWKENLDGTLNKGIGQAKYTKAEMSRIVEQNTQEEQLAEKQKEQLQKETSNRIIEETNENTWSSYKELSDTKFSATQTDINGNKKQLDIKIDSSGNLYTSDDGESSNPLYYINGKDIVQLTKYNINNLNDYEKMFISYKCQNNNGDMQLQRISFDFNEEGK